MFFEIEHALREFSRFAALDVFSLILILILIVVIDIVVVLSVTMVLAMVAENSTVALKRRLGAREGGSTSMGQLGSRASFKSCTANIGRDRSMLLFKTATSQMLNCLWSCFQRFEIEQVTTATATTTTD